MSLVDRHRHQAATYWAPGALDGYGGGRTFMAPVALTVRWQAESRIIQDSSGRQITSAASVVLDQVVELGGYLKLGNSVATDPVADGASEIKRYDETPSVSGRETRRVAWL